tara:strand:- start:766 stop:1473 length:708 start_codon:yes stop_codon:yes gene_type:complete
MSNKVKINVFLPCKKSSSRVKNKNKRKFADIDYGLLRIKINHLVKCRSINKIYLSTNDEKIIKFIKYLKNNKIIIHKRIDKTLSTSKTVTQKLIEHASDVVPDGHILWTHVTSPFVNKNIYEKIIKKYKQIIKKKYDSLMTVTELKGFVWDNKKPINYNSKKIKWPKTQETKPLNKINSAVFLCSRENYINKKNRIGKKPYFYKLSRFEGIDIDEFEDFYFAEYIFKNKKKFLKK